MKQFILLLLFALTSPCTFCQEPEKPKKGTTAYYLQKSSTKKTCGWILIGVGTGLMIGGVSHDLNQLLDNKRPANAVYGIGAISIVSGIALLFSGAHDRQKGEAAMVFLKNEPSPAFGMIGMRSGGITSVGLRFNLH